MIGADITVMFSITRNLYEYAPAVIQNLVETNPRVYRIYLFIEDDEFPYPIDKRVRIININDYPQYISKGPNMNKTRKKMAFTRCFVSKLLLEEKILYFDLDLFFYGGLERLWGIEFDGNYMCGVIEANAVSHSKKDYINTGVLLMDLRAMHLNHVDYDICKFIESKKLTFPDQDAINSVCAGRIKFINHSFNNSKITKKGEDENIPLTISHVSQIKPWDKRSNFYWKWKAYDDKIKGREE